MDATESEIGKAMYFNDFTCFLKHIELWW